MREIICIVCPKGCHINYDEDTNTFSNFICKRGPVYAKKELTNPRRILTTTVEISNAITTRLPVVTDNDIPKEKMFDCMKVLANVKVEAPILVGETIYENILDLGVNIVATKSLEKISSKDC